MRYKVFAVRDRASDLFGTPIFTNSTGTAIRSFADEINRADANNQFYRHPEDYDLYSLGEFDDETGTFDTWVPKQVAVGKDLAAKVN